MTKQARAKAGGERGANGDWYEGGKFIATTDHAKKHGSNKATGRREVECGVWEVPPEGKRSVFNKAAGIVKWDHNTKRFDIQGTWNKEALKSSFPQAFEAAERFNNGARWE